MLVMIFAALVFALVSCTALIGSLLVRSAGSSFTTFQTWGVRAVSLVERWIIRPLLASAGVSTSAWTIQAKSNACRFVGLVAFGLMLLFGELAVRFPK